MEVGVGFKCCRFRWVEGFENSLRLLSLGFRRWGNCARPGFHAEGAEGDAENAEKALAVKLTGTEVILDNQKRLNRIACGSKALSEETRAPIWALRLENRLSSGVGDSGGWRL